MIEGMGWLPFQRIAACLGLSGRRKETVERGSIDQSQVLK